MKYSLFILLVPMFCFSQGLRSPAFVGSIKAPVAGAAFAPGDISGLEIWLKSESISGANGDVFSKWVDSSGNGHNATNNGAYRPLVTNDCLGTFEGLMWDGNNDNLYFGGNALKIARNKTGGTLFFVLAPNKVGGGRLFDINTGGGSYRFWTVQTATNTCRALGQTVDGVSASSSDIATIIPNGVDTENRFLVLTSRATYSSGDWHCFTNGVVAVADTTWVADGTTSDTDSTAVVLGADTGGGNASGAVFVEVLY